ncbi:MAG TPA: type II toxin-antitoxin system prevent-host-death family antitoxin [Dehalococcoidia bacterium]|jgi:prevent-host-death family protein|nr:type II toxin-antitoxin system prevent-host-death family antitoxin [Dehalococcoidia bacterium]
MAEIGIRELKLHASEIMRRVRESKESFEITHRGRVVARIIPVSERSKTPDNAGLWAHMDELAEEIAANWPSGLTASDAVAEQRR